MLKLNIKSSDIVKEVEKKIKNKLEQDLKKTVDALGKTAMKHAEKLADEKLSGNLNKIYKDNLYIEQISDTIVEIGIRQEALWIEEGRKEGFMKELLKGPGAKTSKDGHKYRAIPFEHNMQPSENAPADKKEEIQELKKFFRSQGIRYSKTRALAMDENGSPRIGKIHSFNIKNMRDGKKKSAANLSKNLQGVSVYQKENPQTGRVERSIMTFRTITDGPASEGKWKHPGRKGDKILDDTFKYVQQVWEKELFPELKKKYEKR